MDKEVIRALEDAGIEAGSAAFVPQYGFHVSEDGDVLHLEDTLQLVDGETVVELRLRPASELFTGDVRPPDLSGNPPPAYMPLLLLIESMAAQYVRATQRKVRDREFEKIYSHLRRRPDGRHDDPLFSYLRGAARLMLSVFDVSQAEYEAVIQRLARSARTFAIGPTSTNYTDAALSRLP